MVFGKNVPEGQNVFLGPCILTGPQQRHAIYETTTTKEFCNLINGILPQNSCHLLLLYASGHDTTLVSVLRTRHLA
jgi:hypothetical protein